MGLLVFNSLTSRSVIQLLTYIGWKAMSEFQLTSEIIRRSEAKNWDAAKLEWRLKDVYEVEEPLTCLCGHFPIIEVCILQNKLNNQLATIGNCCVKQFIGLPSDKIFKAIKQVAKENEKSLNAEALQYAYDHRWISDWEQDFYFDIMRKRVLTTKQTVKKLQINTKIIRNIRRIGLGK
jgi:hypothetical protein